MSTQAVARLTVEQYLKIERVAEFRSEYIDGEVFARAGRGPNHALIAAAVIIRLGGQLDDRPCAVAGSDLRLYCPKDQMLTYPDVVVFCEPAKFLDSDEDTLIDAIAIVEVLSPSTQNYDRGEKFRFYRGLPSFSEYLLLAQDTMRAEHHVRQQDGSWLFREFNGSETVLELKSIGCQLRLGTLYRKARLDGH
jgi:Uma2 family endonuclease